MNNLQIFENAEFGRVRTVVIDGEPWFVGKDVAEALGYAKARNAIATHIDEEDKKEAPIQGDLGGTQSMVVINESGLYSLVLSSKLPSAKKFKRWVTAEVLPSIRKTGTYSIVPTGKELLAMAVLEAQKTIEEQSRQIEEQARKIEADKPKTIFADAVAASKTSILIGDLAKLLKQNGIEIGQKRLFEYLRDYGYLSKRKGADWNSPTQRSMELGLFQIKESTVTHADGHTAIHKTTKVTGKGQMYFLNKFLAE